MANHESTRKSCRKIKSRTLINRSRSNRIKTYINKVIESAKSGVEPKSLEIMFQKAQSEIMRGVSKGVLKLNTASNRISRIARKINTV